MTALPDIDRTRVRLHGGRLVHAAEPEPGQGRLRTVCLEYWLDVASDNHWLSGEAPVTCRRCARRLAGEGK